VIPGAAAALIATAVLLTGCSGPDDKEPPVRVMTEQQATEHVRAYAAVIATLAGTDPAATETRISPTPCEGKNGELAEDGRYYMQGNWQMPLAPQQQAATLTGLRDTFTAKGYEIKRFQLFKENEGVVIAENPADGVQITAESTIPPTALAVVVITDCLMPR
jgi:hypothetical protein